MYCVFTIIQYWYIYISIITKCSRAMKFLLISGYAYMIMLSFAMRQCGWLQRLV